MKKKQLKQRYWLILKSIEPFVGPENVKNCYQEMSEIEIWVESNILRKGIGVSLRFVKTLGKVIQFLIKHNIRQKKSKQLVNQRTGKSQFQRKVSGINTSISLALLWIKEKSRLVKKL